MAGADVTAAMTIGEMDTELNAASAIGRITHTAIGDQCRLPLQGRYRFSAITTAIITHPIMAPRDRRHRHGHGSGRDMDIMAIPDRIGPFLSVSIDGRSSCGIKRWLETAGGCMTSADWGATQANGGCGQALSSLQKAGLNGQSRVALDTPPACSAPEQAGAFFISGALGERRRHQPLAWSSSAISASCC